MLDDGSFTGAPLAAPAFGSNALLVGAKRSETGHPLFVAGPQVGYFFPEFFAEMELAGAGFAVRGAVFPGVPLVLIGRGPDFAWSATSSQADNLDLFVETLCEDDIHYLYRGQCEPMRRFLVGTLKAQGQPDQQVSYYETTHGPVVGYATVARQARRDLRAAVDARPRAALDTRVLRPEHRPRHLGEDFLQTMNGVEFSFNWFYADDRDIAMFSSGRLPMRAAGTDPALPTVGTGEYDWRGFLPFAGHARGINPPSGAILNWNNRPAANVGAADSNFAYGSVHRNDLLRAAVAGRKKHTLVTLTGAMNKAATQDLRAVRVWPVIRDVLRTGSAPSARAEAAAGLLDSWRAAGSSRLDRELDGKIDDPGAAVMDAAWPKLADAVMSPVLGPLVGRLAALHGRSDDAGPGGSAYISGWYGYVEKDLRGAARARGARAVLAPLLRCGRARDVPRGAVGGARRSRRRAREGAGPGAVVVAGRRDRRAHPLHVRACCRTRCAGRTGRPSSSSCRSPVTGPSVASYARRVRKRYLMAPGPTPVPPEALAAGAEPIIHHRGPDFRELMLRTLGRLRQVCRTENDVLLFTASGSGAFESAIVNLLSPGERVLVVTAGAFGDRWCEMATAFGADVHELRYSVGRDAPAGRPALAARRDRSRGRRPRALGDVDRRRRRRAGARARRAGGGRARGRRRGVESRRRPARDGRVGSRRRRRRLAEGADDAAGPLADDGLRRRLGALAPFDDAALLLRLGADARGARGGLDAVHARRHRRRVARRLAGAAARGGSRDGLRPPRRARPRLPRGREGDGARALLARRGALGRS